MAGERSAWEGEVEDDAGSQVGPAAQEEGGWGPWFPVDAKGAVLPEVAVKPFSDGRFWVETAVFEPGVHARTWSDGPYDGQRGKELRLPFDPAVVDARGTSLVRVRVVATDDQGAHVAMSAARVLVDVDERGARTLRLPSQAAVELDEEGFAVAGEIRAEVVR